ncbi:MAG: O-antigen ligase family protein [Kiritimatiellae bacterium]|nr:O-antigen ligase family protein [Kiritimatiellia bacterium]
MKYLAFAVTAFLTPFFAYVLSWNRRWIRFAFVPVLAALCFFDRTSINFFAVSEYRGTARGMEVSLAYLAAFAVILALKFRGVRIRWVPSRGAALFLVYFLLCLPSLTAADNLLYAWFEIWKLALLYLFLVAVENYLRATDDAGTVLLALGLFAMANFAFVAKQHFAGVWQPKGCFDHRNGLAFCMNLLGPVFFAGYLMKGLGTRWGRFFFVAFVSAAFAAIRSYSRTALVLIPLGYGLAWCLCMAFGKPRNAVRRSAWLAALAALALAVMLPRIVQRFETAGTGSKSYRIQTAKCAMEMIADEPLRGVGINNWGVKVNPPYPYAQRAGIDRSNMERTSLYHEGIVETVYLLVAAECGIPCLLAFVAWLLHYAFLAFRLCPRLAGTARFFVPAGLAAGLSVIVLESCMEWTLRMRQPVLPFMAFFAILEYLAESSRHGAAAPTVPSAKGALPA